MATGDKLVTLDGLKAVYQDVNGNIVDIKERLNDAGMNNNVVDAVFVNGAITVTSQALVYSEATTTCVTEQGKPIVVDPGTVFHLTDPATYKFRAWYGGYNQKWYVASSNYGTSDMTVPSDKQRMYAFQIARNDGAAITPQELEGKFQIILPNRYPGTGAGLYKTFSLSDNLDLTGALPTSGTGAATTGASYALTHFIPVKQGMQITYNLASAGGNVMAFYNQHLEYAAIASVESGGSSTAVASVASGTGTVTVSADGFVRISVDASGTGNYVYFSNYGIPDQISQELAQLGTTVTGISQELPGVKSAVEGEVGTDYMQSAVARITGQLRAKAELGNTVTFGFNTDQHVVSVGNENYDSVTKPVLRGMKALSMLTREYPYDFVCLGGDSCNSAAALAGTFEEILGQCIDIQKPLYDAWCPVIPLPGNHEATQNNDQVTNGMLFNAYAKRIAGSGLLTYWKHNGNDAGPLDAWSGGPLNAYWDSKVHKIRFIFFDDCFGGSNSVRSYGSTGRNNALSGMLAGTPEGYNIVILSHHALSNALTDPLWNSSNCACQSVLAPYADRIICCICGHNHADISETDENGILYICVTNAQIGADRNNHTSTLDTESETAFDTFVIDQTAQKIYAFRYGKGGTDADREWTYTLGS